MKMNQKFVSSAIASTLVIGGLSFGVVAANASAGVDILGNHSANRNTTATQQSGNSTQAWLAQAGYNDTFNDTRAAQNGGASKVDAAVVALAQDSNGNSLIGEKGKNFVVPGEKVNYRVTGFKAGETVKLSLHSVVVELGEKQADANGVVAGSFTVPANFTNGKHKFIVKGLEKTIELAFEVKEGKDAADEATDNGKGGAKLANTGSNVEFGAAAGAVALVLAGAGVFVARRRNA